MRPNPQFAAWCILLATIACSPGCISLSEIDSSGPAPQNLPPRPLYSTEEPLLSPPAPPRGQVTFYTLPRFRGDSFTVEAGSSLDRLDAWDNDISSFRIEGPVSVQIFSDPRYRGQGLETSSSLPDLIAESRGRSAEDNWDNTISSLRVIASHGGGYGPPTPAAPRIEEPRYDRRSAENVVRRAYREVFGREVDARGLVTYSDLLMNGTLSEESLRQRLRTSPEFDRVDHAGFIARAYREILKREPDASGLEHYRALMVNDGWTQSQVRADLLRSAERADAAARAIVLKAYRDVLRREPDAGGLGTYVGRVVNDGWNAERVRQSLQDSDEFRRLSAPPPPSVEPPKSDPAPPPNLNPRRSTTPNEQ